MTDLLWLLKNETVDDYILHLETLWFIFWVQSLLLLNIVKLRKRISIIFNWPLYILTWALWYSINFISLSFIYFIKFSIVWLLLFLFPKLPKDLCLNFFSFLYAYLLMMEHELSIGLIPEEVGSHSINLVF